MNDNGNESIEAMLRQSFDGPVPDDGFVERVMQALPARRERRRWLLPAGIITGGITSWAALASTSLVRIASHDWMNGKLSASTLIMLGVVGVMALLASCWAVAEAE